MRREHSPHPREGCILGRRKSRAEPGNDKGASIESARVFDPALTADLIGRLEARGAEGTASAADRVLKECGDGFACRFVIGSWLLTEGDFRCGLHHLVVGLLTCPLQDDDYPQEVFRQQIALAVAAVEADQLAIRLLAEFAPSYTRRQGAGVEYWRAVLSFVRQHGYMPGTSDIVL